MTTSTAFVDESLRNGLHLCGVVVPDGRLGEIRAAVRSLAHPRTQLHMKSRSDRERVAYLRGVAGMGLTAAVASRRARVGENDRDLRDDTLTRLGQHLAREGVARMVIETCGQDDADRRVLRRALGASPALVYEFWDKSEVLLGLPDVVAWAYPYSKKWRSYVEAMVTQVR
ncbi:hypothetical protein [Nocardioides yefusunii]|uniref:Uncharacterized protein n=1 Tax=Nocardioides yefusunii TaxID=2500546 RepID=A0ABW1R218_9ACTN|nr:hypothetical protein [Nocardioides yefusunii]